MQAIIKTFVSLVKFPTGLGVSNAQIAAAIMSNVDACAFDTHNNKGSRIVEVHATFTAKNTAGKVFELLIIWGEFTSIFLTLGRAMS